MQVGVTPGKTLGDVQGAVRGSVLNDNHFRAVLLLFEKSKHLLQCTGQAAFLVMSGDYKRQKRRVSGHSCKRPVPISPIRQTTSNANTPTMIASCLLEMLIFPFWQVSFSLSLEAVWEQAQLVPVQQAQVQALVHHHKEKANGSFPLPPAGAWILFFEPVVGIVHGSLTLLRWDNRRRSFLLDDLGSDDAVNDLLGIFRG